ncbi:MAG TPA: hypothetical protein VNU46_04770 [Gemmatimonadaceae bacterium]|nr:hypothetical protein [Gemmatimonadaceae bacterium]
MEPDFLDFVEALLRAQARFLVVGAQALAVHGVPRATGDIDIWIDQSADNAACVWAALLDFGAPVGTLQISPNDLRQPNMVVQIGVPPCRIDILTDVSGIAFADAWDDRFVCRVSDMDIPFIGRTAFIQNKRASGRFKDLGDLEALGETV